MTHSLLARIGVVGVLVLLAPLGLSGCNPIPFFFPSRPNDAPVWMSVDQVGFIFVWCGEEPYETQGIYASVAVYSPGREDIVLMDGSGPFTWDRGVAVSTGDPPPSLTYDVRSDLEMKDVRATVFLATSREGKGDLNGLDARFDVDSLTDLQDSGGWVNPQGDRRDSSC